jgi:protein-disulfide isomerase
MRAEQTRRFLLAAAAAATLAACGGSSGAAEGEMAMGQANAPVTVVEYASVTCSHCATFNEEVFPAFKKKYVDTGRVRYVFREFLTPPADVAAAGFLVARCAGPQKYFSVVDAIMRSQREMFTGGGANVRPVLLRIAQTAGMTEQQFNTCINDEKQLDALNARVDAGLKAGINSTPTFIINGTKLEGTPTLATLDAAIAKAKK